MSSELNIENNNFNINEEIERLKGELEKSKEKKPSIQKKYSEYLKALTIYSSETISSTEVDMLEWQGNFWKVVTKVDGIDKALKWLERNYPQNCDKELALRCFETAKYSLLNLFTFNEIKDYEIILPLKNNWLYIDSRKPDIIKMIQPDKKLKIKYVINGYVDLSKVDQKTKRYYPAKMKEGYFKDFIMKSLEEDDKRDMLQEYLGYTLMNDTRYQTSLWNVGDGSNGKGILLSLIENLHETTISLNLEELDGFELDNLPYTSLVVVPEVEPKGFNETKFKGIIAGDKTQIKIKNKGSLNIKPRAKWIIMCNEIPRIKDQTDGVLRRMIIINWNKQFLGKDKIVGLEKLIINNEYEQFIDWCLIGLQRLLTRGDFLISENLKEFKDAFIINNNSVKSFINNSNIEIEKNNDYTLSKEYIYEEYLKYCKSKFIDNVTAPNRFWSIMKSHFKEALIETRKRVRQDNRVDRVTYINLSFNLCIEDIFKENKTENKINTEMKKEIEEEKEKEVKKQNIIKKDGVTIFSIKRKETIIDNLIDDDNPFKDL